MDINIMIKTAVDNINAAVDAELQVRTKAIKVAIRYHFCDIEGDELEIYETLSDWEDDGDLPYVVWQPFEDMTPTELWDNIDGLIDDIVRTFLT